MLALLKEAEELEHWDSRPLRQRERTASCVGQALSEKSPK